VTDTDAPRADLSWPALMRRAHATEHAEDWQYAVVWRFAAEGDPVELDDPPTEGTGWERNIDRADDGREVTVPRWSDGSKVMHLSYWRRKSPGTKPWQVRHKLHEQREA